MPSKKIRKQRSWLISIISIGFTLLLLFSDADAHEKWRTADDINHDGKDLGHPLLVEPTVTISIFPNGRVFAQTINDFLISNDQGVSWSSITLPTTINSAEAIITVDPIDTNTIYAADIDLLYKTVDQGKSWRPILPQSNILPEFVNNKITILRVLAVVVSPANQSIIYAILAGTPPPQSHLSGNSGFVLLSSLDGGRTWLVRRSYPYGDNTCRWEVELLQAHPTDPNRLFLSAPCLQGIVNWADLEQSVDQGKTFTTIWAGRATVGAMSIQESPVGYPQHLVGGRGDAPTRWYLAVNRDYRLGGSTLLRSDDDGMTWGMILTYRGGSLDPTLAIPNSWNVQIAGLAYDPAHPDHVYVARNALPPFDVTTGVQAPPVTSGVTESRDGGVTWSDLGSQQLGTITDLLLSPDGQRLYVASDQGVRVMELAP